MPIDANIALGVKPVEVENPLNALARMMQVQGLQQQNEIGRMTMEQSRLDRADLNALRTDLKAPGADPYSTLLRYGKVKEAGDWRKSESENAERKSKTAGMDFDLRVKKADRAIMDIAAFDTPEAAFADMQRKLAAGELDEAKFQSLMQTMPRDPALFPKWQLSMVKNIMSAKDRMALEVPDANAVLTSNTSLKTNAATTGLGYAKLKEDARHHGVVEGQGATTAENGKWQYDAERGGLVNLKTGEFKPATQGGAPIGPKVKPDNASEGERKAATLLKRLAFSETQLETALADDKSAATPSLLSNGLRTVGMEAAANKYDGSTRQRVEGAQLDILDAALTLGTGAAYTRDQLEGYRKSYFPQIGDDAKAIDDKKARLANVIQAAKIAAGRAAPKTPETPTKTVKRTGKTADGKKVIEYTDGSVEYAS